jgi:hypothetical protein
MYTLSFFRVVLSAVPHSLRLFLFVVFVFVIALPVLATAAKLASSDKK